MQAVKWLILRYYEALEDQVSLDDFMDFGEYTHNLFQYHNPPQISQPHSTPQSHNSS